MRLVIVNPYRENTRAGWPYQGGHTSGEPPIGGMNVLRGVHVSTSATAKGNHQARRLVSGEFEDDNTIVESDRQCSSANHAPPNV